MDFNGVELEKLVARILEEVQSRTAFSKETDEDVQGTVALFTCFVPSKHACACKLTGLFGTGIDCALLNGAKFSAPGFYTFEVNTDEERDGLLDRLAGAANVALVTPPLGLLYNLADGKDDGFIEQAFLRPLLWGRNVTILLDFDIPRFKRATFFERVVDSIDRLTRMGVRIEAYKPSAQPNEHRKSLVTETDITDAKKQGLGRIMCEKGAIVTPLARERADELGISIDW